jgi:ADP-ribose pyrophosphatase
VLIDDVWGVDLRPVDRQPAIDKLRAADVPIQQRARNHMPHENQRTLYAGRHLTMLERRGWEFVTRKTQRPAVGIVAITDTGHVVLVEQFRAPVGRAVVELPAGLTGDMAGTEDEPLVEAAQRELMEETGYAARRWTELCRGYSSPGLTNESIVFFLAEGLTRHHDGGGDESEDITVHEVELDGLLEWLAERAAEADMKLLAGLYAAKRHLQVREG